MNSRTQPLARALSTAWHATQRLIEAGPVPTFRWARHEVLGRYHEWRLGIVTGGTISGRELSPNPDANEYEAVSYEALRTAFGYLGVCPGEDVFLDYGSGMGRAVVFAATYPFRRVVGVELNSELCRIAEENLRKARRLLVCPAVEIINADAASFCVPDDVSTILLFNSFTGATLASVVARIGASLERAPRPLTIVYMRPAAEPDALAACAWLVKDRDLPSGWWTWVKFCTYRARALQRHPSSATLSA